ncbi:MAG: EAL domain-containing protein [Agarilytica sp.]
MGYSILGRQRCALQKKRFGLSLFSRGRFIIPAIRYVAALLFFLASQSFALVENTISSDSEVELFSGVIPNIQVLETDQVYRPREAKRLVEKQPVSSIPSPNYGFSNKTYWAGWSLTNATPTQKDLYLEIAYNMLDSVKIFFFDKQSGELQSSYDLGDRKPFKERPVHAPNFVVPFHLISAQTLDILVEIDTSSSSQFPILLWSERGLTSSTHDHAAFVGGLIGIILVLAVYNLFLFVSLKDLSYLQMVFVLLGYACVEGALTGFSYFYFWPESPAWNERSLAVMGNVGLANLCLFSRSFLSLPRSSPRLSGVLYLSAILGFFLCALSFFVPYRYMIVPTALNVAYSAVLTYSVGLYLMFRGYKQAYFYNAAFFVFVIASVFFVLEKFGLIARTGFSEYGIHIGAVLTSVIFSFALADRIKREKNEKEAAQETAIANLEKYRSIYEYSLEGMFRITARGKLLACNPAFANLMGVATESVLIESINKISDYIPASKSDLNKIIAIIGQDGHVFGYETVCRRVDGTEFWGAIYAKFMNDPKFGRVIDASIVDITDKKESEEKLTFMASHDLLTGLANRVGFRKKLDQAVRVSCESGRVHSLLFMDLDQFKVVNDTSGHSAGDELLKQLSVLFKKHLRDADTIARLGGDEFSILLFDCQLPLASEIAERLRDEVSEHRFYWNEKVFSVGVSIGIVPIDQNVVSAEELMRLADTACYAAKDAGRNRVIVHEAHSLDIPARQTEMNLANTLKEAIGRDDLVLFKQNIQALDNTEGGDRYEILVRLMSDGEIILPGGFLPAAERFDAIEQLDYWVTNAYFSWLSSHPEALARLDIANINISGRTLGNDNFGDYLEGLFEKYAIPKEKICFEITESAAISNLAYTSRFINRMTKNGLQFSLDDFGSGFSSYSYLKMLPVKSLKIDGSFIKDLPSDPINFAMVKSIIEVAHIMGLEVTAEFVESEEILDALADLGVDLVQGFHIHMPELLSS